MRRAISRGFLDEMSLYQSFFHNMPFPPQLRPRRPARPAQRTRWGPSRDDREVVNFPRFRRAIDRFHGPAIY